MIQPNRAVIDRPTEDIWYSEVDPERKLNIPLASADAAALSRDFPEVGAGGIEIHATTTTTSPIGMVKHVKCFGAELSSLILTDRKCLKQSKVPVVESGLIHQIADPLRVRSEEHTSELQSPC